MIQRTGRVPEHVFSGAAMVLDPAQLVLTILSVICTVIVLYLEVLVYSRKYLCVHSLHKKYLLCRSYFSVLVCLFLGIIQHRHLHVTYAYYMYVCIRQALCAYV